MAKIKVGLIPACGKGNRISELPLTKVLPKPMLPVLDKPIIHHVVERMNQMGIEMIYITAFHLKETIQKYFGDGSEFGVEIKFIIPDEYPPGLGDSVYLANEYIKEPFVTILGDDFTLSSSPEIFPNTFFDKKALVVEGVVKDTSIDSLKRTCCVHLSKDGKIFDIVEKPERPKWKMRGCGIYVFDPIIFEYIKTQEVDPEKGKKDLTKAIQTIARKTKRVYGVPVDVNININTLSDLHQATLFLLAEQEKFLKANKR
ncbi:MAG: nucleotidyltransferase family protein [bacterium]|nr:nucleotidyltransferase family protein [bacterium]